MEPPVSGEEEPRRCEKLPRRSILRRRAVLRELRERGKRRSNRYCVLMSKPCEVPERTQAAFLTPKRIGGATVRNRVRRRMREIYRRFILTEREPLYLVWLARSEAVAISFEKMKEAMLQLCDGQKISRRGP